MAERDEPGGVFPSLAAKVGAAYYAWLVTLAAVAFAAVGGVSPRDLGVIAIALGPLVLMAIVIWTGIGVRKSGFSPAGRVEAPPAPSFEPADDRVRRAAVLRDYARSLRDRGRTASDSEMWQTTSAIERLALKIEAGDPSVPNWLVPEEYILEVERYLDSRRRGDDAGDAIADPSRREAG